MFGLMWTRTHDAEMAAVKRDRDDANAALAQADTHIAGLEVLLANAYVRGPKGHFQRASLPLPPAPEQPA